MSLMTLSFPSVRRRASRSILRATWNGVGLQGGSGTIDDCNGGGGGHEARSVIFQGRERPVC